MTWIAHHAEVLDVLSSIESNSVDGCLTDVPYGLGPRQPRVDELIAYLQGADVKTGGDFMGKRWSVPSVQVWRELHRVLKPGAHVLSFAGSRTSDLISLGMRAGGFEVRDQIQWIYVSAMPKSTNISKAIDKKLGATRKVIGVDPSAARRNKTVPKFKSTYGEFDVGFECPLTEPSTEEAAEWEGMGSGLKPAHEPVIVARKALDGTLIDNVCKWGVGSLSIDACRIEYASEEDRASVVAGVEAIRARGGSMNNSWKNSSDLSGASPASALGRWPANVCLDEGSAAILDEQSGDRPGMSGGGKHSTDYAGGMFGAIDSTGTARNDNGGASRFLFVAKASRQERERGCDHLPMRKPGANVNRDEDSVGIQNGRAGAGRTAGVRNYGPCVKPIALTRWLAALILPPPRKDGSPRRILVPYAGTGSEMVGALLAGWDLVEGIEREPRAGSKDDFMSILRARVHLAATNPRAFDPECRKAPKPDERQVSLFGRIA